MLVAVFVRTVLAHPARTDKRSRHTTIKIRKSQPPHLSCRRFAYSDRQEDAQYTSKCLECSRYEIPAKQKLRNNRCGASPDIIKIKKSRSVRIGEMARTRGREEPWSGSVRTRRGRTRPDPLRSPRRQAATAVIGRRRGGALIDVRRSLGCEPKLGETVCSDHIEFARAVNLRERPPFAIIIA